MPTLQVRVTSVAARKVMNSWVHLWLNSRQEYDPFALFFGHRQEVNTICGDKVHHTILASLYNSFA